MNLTKYFNLKYLLQNIKKSKMALSIFLIVVPMFTSLMILSTSREVFNYETIGVINILGMYFIPFLLSASLFDYVYKKSSVDFMCSMPISRKCIFITNTIGGIVLIFAMQLITLILSLLLCSATGSVLFLSCALDIFVYQMVAYIFIFTISNLAMSLSGNLLTQIVVTLLIALLIPFSTLFVNLYNSSNTVALVDKYNTGLNFERTFNFTAPLSFANASGFGYNSISLIKMIVLSIVYIVVGYFAFNKRKMEVAGDSFEKQKVHQIVKGLTLAPFIALLIAAIDAGVDEGVIILLGIITIYYFIYDLITGKKIKLKENIIGLIISSLVMFGAYYAIVVIDDKIERTVDIKDITSVSMEYRGFEYEVKDQKDIQDLFNGSRPFGDSGFIYTNITIMTRTGARYKDYIYVSTNMLNKLQSGIHEIANINSDMSIRDSYFEFEANEERKLKELIIEAFNNLSNEEIKSKLNRAIYDINVSTYVNHKMLSTNCPIDLTPEIFDLATRVYNRNAVTNATNNRRDSWYNVTIYKNGEYIDGANYFDDYVSWNEAMKAFIIENANEVPTISENIAIIRGNDAVFITNKTDDLVKTLNKFKLKEEKAVDEIYYNAGKTVSMITEE